MEGLRDRQTKVVTGLSSKTPQAEPSDPPLAAMVALHSEIAVDDQLVLRAQNGDRFAQGMGFVRNCPRSVSANTAKQRVLSDGMK